MSLNPIEQVSRAKLEQLLQYRFETQNLDYKASVDLSTTRGKVELAKDVLAMANSGGGHIVLGVQDGTFEPIGVSDEHARHLRDGATVNEKLRTYCGGEVTVHVAHHFLSSADAGPRLVLLYVPAFRGKIPARDNGAYGDPATGKQSFAFRQGDVLVRKADQSIKVQSPEDLLPVEPLREVVMPSPTSHGSDFANPYDFSRAATREMFKGRQREINELLDAIESGTHTAVFGLQRIGKTSLVEEAIVDRLPARPTLRDKTLFAKVDLQRIGSLDVCFKDFFSAIIHSIAEAASTGLGLRDLEASVDTFLAESAHYKRGRKLQIPSDYERAIEILVKASGCRVVLFLDEFSEVCRMVEKNEDRKPGRSSRANLHPNEMPVDIALMHWLSALLKNPGFRGRLVVILAVRPFVAEYDRQRELQILKLTRPIILCYLDEKSALDLIRDPLAGRVSYEAGAADYLYDVTAGHPYLIQFMLREIVDDIRRSERRTITLDDIRQLERRMVTEGAAYDAQFDVLDSDYSVDEVMNAQRSTLGRGVLAYISKMGHERKQGWVEGADIVQALARHGCSVGEVERILDQLVSSKILQEDRIDGVLCFRMWIPLLRKRYVTQNKSLKFFHSQRR